ncbi:MAG: hypothetical protein JJU12_03945 [Chlamydiales bacterium]|nr:hypothetical protein [Chlamydiales bacterium]
MFHNKRVDCNNFFMQQAKSSKRTAGEIACALWIIASIGAMVAGGIGWLPAYATYAGFGALALGLVVLAALFHCKSDPKPVVLLDPTHRRKNSTTVSTPPPPIFTKEVVGKDSASALIPFYSGKGEDAEGRNLEFILSQTDPWLEATHNFIQWLFPAFEPSKFNSKAPLLTTELLGRMKSDGTIIKNVLRAFDRMLTFYGLQCSEEGIVRSENWEERKKNWVTSGNHNYLRITRILNFMNLMGFEQEVSAFKQQLLTIANENPYQVTDKTVGFWTKI